MRKLMSVAVLMIVVGFMAKVSHAADEATVKGVLIDKSCSAKFLTKDDPEKAAEAHPAACAAKCGKEGGLGVISGKKFLVFDEAGQKLAKEFLEKNKSTKIEVKGTEKGDEIAVASIEAAK